MTAAIQTQAPFSVLLAKAVYRSSGGSAPVLHALSLALHFAAGVLVYHLCRMLTRSTGWSLVGGLLFVIHSHSVYAVGWLAAQNSVLQTVLLLAALLSYIRASGLDVYAGYCAYEHGGAVASAPETRGRARGARWSRSARRLPE